MKRILLLAIMVFCIAMLCHNNAKADSITQSEMLESILSWEGKTGYNGYCLKWVQVAWKQAGVNTGESYYSGRPASASAYWSRLVNEKRANQSAKNPTNIPIGADVFFSSDSGNGHIGIYIGDGWFMNPVATVHKTKFWDDDKHGDYYGNRYLGWAWHDYVTILPDPRGTEMTTGYDRVLPDGDYIITAGADPHYFLDLPGNSAANNNDNAQIWYTADIDSITDYNVWTITYSNGFYKIQQHGTNKCLDVCDGDTLRGENVQAYTDNGASAQKWAISRNGRKGYQIQAKCSGYALDIVNGTLANGTNVRQWECNKADAQSWLFIPYMPSQPVAEGRYILLYEGDESFELDVSGDTGDIENNRNVQVWKDTAPSEFNSFDFIKLSNGYYKVRHAASGKCLDVTSWSSAYHANVAVYDDRDNPPQQWAVIGNTLISRCNGYALELVGGTLQNGGNVGVYPRLNSAEQQWVFVPAEYTISYMQEGFLPQTKFYKANLVLTETSPEADGLTFLGWATNPETMEVTYQPGDIYAVDSDVTMYPVWKSAIESHTITYMGNYENMPEPQTFTGSAIISDKIPIRAGYTFQGWTTQSLGSKVEYEPGSEYTGNADIILYAVWEGNEYTVYFDPNGGTCDTPSKKVRNAVFISMYGMLPGASRLGYSFAGWFTEPDGGRRIVMGTNVNLTEDQTLYAHWKALDQLDLPANLLEIKEEAFCASSSQYVEIPRSCTKIGSRAFADCTALRQVRIYSETTEISSDAFEGCSSYLIIYCDEGSRAYEVAVENEIRYVVVE